MVKRCPSCDVYIEWMWTRTGRKLPFELPIPIDDSAAADGWVPGQWYVRGVKRVVLYPLCESSATRRSNIRRVVLPHRCDTYYRTMFEDAMTKKQTSRSA